ncbi:MAG: gfo/Idh/MocA family oxidoreductase [Actinobacteria bacterium]|nr:gfo/Idh/MocA family oxidoreductase [Actinomycetota bacterium]
MSLPSSGRDVDAIYVATPHSLHAENSILALNAGKPVLCEKPFAVNATQAEAMIEASKNNSVALMEAMWSRFLPHYQVVREIVDSGELGELVALYADHGQPLPADRYYRLHAPELAGGALLDLGIYPISLAFMVLGEPDSIIASSQPTASGVDAQTSMIFSYFTGQQAVMTTTLKVRTPCTAQIIGTKGRINIDSNFYTPTSIQVIIEGKVAREYPKKYLGHGIREQAREFAQVVRSGELESPIMSQIESLAIMHVMDEIREMIDLKYPFEAI